MNTLDGDPLGTLNPTHQGMVKVSSHSCIGDRSCGGIWMYHTMQINISCRSKDSCTWIGSSQVGKIVIGADSCVAENSCKNFATDYSSNFGLLNIVGTACSGASSCLDCQKGVNEKAKEIHMVEGAATCSAAIYSGLEPGPAPTPPPPTTSTANQETDCNFYNGSCSNCPNGSSCEGFLPVVWGCKCSKAY